MRTYTTHSKEETRALGKELALGLRPASLITFSGELGAGKTTLIQGILEGLGALPPYPSPTFVLMNQYDLEVGLPSEGVRRVYHADAYRVGAADFEKLGFTEWCMDPTGIVLLEWPERLAEILPDKRIDITLRTLSEIEREISITTIE